MCIIIDVNVLPSVFSSETKNHSEYKPVYDWFIGPNGKIVFGGSKYKGELLAMRRYHSLLVRYAKMNKVAYLEDEVVDKIQEDVKSKTDDSDFDDPHIIAIVIVSKGGIVCSDDKRSYRFIKDTAFYPDGIQVPRIYSNASNKDLLSKKKLTTISYKHVTNC